MGWRYEVIILGCITLTVFFLRYFVFHFYESPKFLISRGKEVEAIEVLHKIAKFNKAPPPTLTVEDLQSIDRVDGPIGHTESTKNVLRSFLHSFKHLKGLFLSKLQSFIFFLLAVAYMVRLPIQLIVPIQYS